MSIPVGILTVSDKCSKGQAADTSGPALAQVLTYAQSAKRWTIVATSVVPDDKQQIHDTVQNWCRPRAFSDDDEPLCRLVIVTGGTGISPSDVTVGAIEPLFTKQLPALATAMVVGSLNITPMAALSQVAAGVVNDVAIVLAVPGSKKGSTENVQQVLPVLPHAIDTLMARSGTRHLHPAEEADIAAGQKTSERRQPALCGCSREETKDLPDGEMPMATGVSNDLGASVVHRKRKSPYPMIPVSTALSLVLSSVAVMDPVELPLSDIQPGQVIAKDVVAQENVPGYPASVMDGYAVVAADGPGSYAVRGSSTAGSTADAVTEDNPLKPGQIVRITTGAPMPPGADAVVMVEDTELLLADRDANNGADGEEEEQQVRILDSGTVQPGQHVRAIGHDLSKGATVLHAGDVVTTVGGEIGTLAVSGNRTFSVYTAPRIAVMSTGDEVVDVSSPNVNDGNVDLSPGALAYGAIRDCNRPALVAGLKALGCEIMDLGVVRDDPDLIAQTIRGALDQCQGIITTGGVSMGERDWLKPVVEQRLGGHIRFGRVAMKPSKPTTFATIPTDDEKTKKFIFALPGNPVSALVAFHMFVAPAVRLLSGYMKRDGPAAAKIVYDGRVTQEALCVLRPSVVAAFEGPDVTLDRVRPEYVRGSLVWNQRTCKWTVRMVDQKQQSSRVASMQRSNALISLPRGANNKGTVTSGELVTAVVIAPPHFS
ncbi:hypothetical protein IW140_002569 [Coemansia sp. RSA 1813]|nr:hypothetical protein EV178_002101 [Coemansia sp. RSA 1646]KAJ1772730.1 hypothetical protein LPJ74_001256 [Coemansia sp. RSA 1843]KAJ2090682.1 hypothetical protein IW138_002496 [Coemansia sp. RSA 986]KAJ2216114.1 hypothetical protein EV179_001574 [Coemansia sp. RSA 487]KAJ2570099.1 hypothetical protein IW140_002569 [Coemansia sp. RSA 1813]